MADNASAATPFDFLRVVEVLKQTPRTGWLIRGIESPESVSDHMYRMAIMVMMVPDIDAQVKDHAVKMALAHDIGEAITGDIAPSDGVSKRDKQTRERLALQYLSALLQEVSPSFAEQLVSLWEEYEQNESEASKLVHSIDALECMDQAFIYEQRSRRKLDLGEFMQLRSKVQHPSLVRWAEIVEKDRDQLWNADGLGIHVVFVLGGPGVGKGTQCGRLARDLGCLHISVGDLFREEAASDSHFAEFIRDSMQNSVIIPAGLTMRLIEKKMKACAQSQSRILLLDGFPRSIEQIDAFQTKFQDTHSTILIEAPESVMIERLQKRASSSDRADDDEEVVKKRLRTWEAEKSVLEAHLVQTIRFARIDGGQPEDLVFKAFKSVVNVIVTRST